MRGFWQKIKGSWIGSFLFSCLLISIFSSLFFLVNLDLKPASKNQPISDSSVNFDLEGEIKKRLSGIDVSAESYSAWIVRLGLNASNSGLDQDPDKDDLVNYLEYVYGTNPLASDTDKDTYSDKSEIVHGYDPDAPGDSNIKPRVEISIAKIKILAPMIWSKSEHEQDMLRELENGLGHYLKTSAPGQKGNMIVSGHSSNYLWAKGDYNHVFKDLDNLEKGDVITATTFQKNGKIIIYRYVVSEKFVTVPNDTRIFENSQNSILTLSTCWPIGTNFRRLIVKAQLQK